MLARVTQARFLFIAKEVVSAVEATNDSCRGDPEKKTLFLFLNLSVNTFPTWCVA